jgi:hypothetical protein
MKTQVLNIVVISLFACILGWSCGLGKDSSRGPGIAIYKTNGDYFNLVDVGMKGDKFIRTESFWNNRYDTFDKMEVVDNDTIYKYRWRLINGYVLDKEADYHQDVFLSLTFKEYLAKEIGMGKSLSHDTLKKYIIDKDPFTEFYSSKSEPYYSYYSIDTAEFNSIIRNGELEKYFERLK